MFNKILIANRGEIALRIIRTCHEMGIESVAVYSDIDRTASFVYSASEAYGLGGKTSQESYLQGSKIIDIALKCGAEAIHPGYGFLSENAAFAEAVEKAGLVFIGPEAQSIRTMGSKTAARSLMLKNKVPVVPGTEQAIKDFAKARKLAAEMGYPVLIKAAAGGGGKGMRLVDNDASFIGEAESAAREAKAAFNDDTLYLEKFVEEPRHIEFQVLADNYGNTIHLGERECSIQRRHQKIVEEAPSSLLDDALRTKMGESAINAAKACNYRNAGTIEFLVDKNRNFYFLEMNTRLQVEHPVTELVTGLDLVEQQIRIASGEKLSIKESFTQFWGHAFECRLYAEDPANNWAPSPGRIEYINRPAGPGIREDSSVTKGSEVSLYYDPLISKLCVWGASRAQAAQRMLRALREYEITGIKTSIPFLIRVFDHPKFQKGDFTTAFIAENEKDLYKDSDDLAEIAAITSVLVRIQEKNQAKMNIAVSPSAHASRWRFRHRKLYSEG